jgi:hypothetical protein
MTIYLYVKTHNITGLKYLGKTTAKNPHKYSGSGLYWKRHLKEHGRNYSTEIIKECSTPDEIKQWGMYYSELWDVVSSEEWANLTPEQGDGGPQSIDTRVKMSKAKIGHTPWNKGKIGYLTEEQRKAISEANRARGPQTEETIAKRISKTTGKTRTKEQKGRMSAAQKGKVFSGETRQKMRYAAQNRKSEVWNKGRTNLPSSATSKVWVIENTVTTYKETIVSLRKWCIENNLQYSNVHKNAKQFGKFKEYLISLV